tara:strand:+ start:5396 stop:6034 length:639 start_codon:yes stop_codon:yes gene_type:complete
MENNSVLPEIIEAPVIEEDIEDILPEEVPKLKIDKDEVFANEPDPPTPPKTLRPEPVPIVADTPVVKKPKRKRQMTPEALEKLAKAREKAMETRRKNAALRKEGKMKMPKQIKEDKIKEEKEAMRPVVNNITHETKNITNNITEDDIRKIALETSAKATQSALDGYEKVRKARKEEKRKAKEKELEKQKIHNTIKKAQGKALGQDGFFSDCF